MSKEVNFLFYKMLRIINEILYLISLFSNRNKMSGQQTDFFTLKFSFDKSANVILHLKLKKTFKLFKTTKRYKKFACLH